MISLIISVLIGLVITYLICLGVQQIALLNRIEKLEKQLKKENEDKFYFKGRRIYK